jgi:hypothetical protein
MFWAVCCNLVFQNHSSLIYKIDPISNSHVDVQKTWRRKSGLFPALNVDGASGVRTVRTPLGPSIVWAGKRPHNRGPVLPANSRQCLEIFCFTVLYFSLPQQVLSFNHEHLVQRDVGRRGEFNCLCDGRASAVTHLLGSHKCTVQV